jgi:hypothetical protein
MFAATMLPSSPDQVILLICKVEVSHMATAPENDVLVMVSDTPWKDFKETHHWVISAGCCVIYQGWSWSKLQRKTFKPQT